MKKIFLILLALSSILFAELSKKGGIVTDSITKLQWQDDTVGEKLAWEAAIAQCEALDLGGYTDWRLPNIKELSSIIDDTRHTPAVTLVFQNTAVDFYDVYWSSTTYAKYDVQAFLVRFKKGNVEVQYKSYDNHVRCVRVGE